MSYLNPYGWGLGSNGRLVEITGTPGAERDPATIDVVPPPAEWTVRRSSGAMSDAAKLRTQAVMFRAQGNAGAAFALEQQAADLERSEQAARRAAFSRLQAQQTAAYEAKKQEEARQQANARAVSSWFGEALNQQAQSAAQAGRAAEVARRNAEARAAVERAGLAPGGAGASGGGTVPRISGEALARQRAAADAAKAAIARQQAFAASPPPPAGPASPQTAGTAPAPAPYTGPVYTPGRITETVAALRAPSAGGSVLAPLAPLSLPGAPSVAVQTPSTMSRVLPWAILGVLGLVVVVGVVSYFREEG